MELSTEVIVFSLSDPPQSQRPLARFSPRLIEAGLHRTRKNPKLKCCLGMAQALPITVEDCFSLADQQLADSISEPLRRFAASACSAGPTTSPITAAP